MKPIERMWFLNSRLRDHNRKVKYVPVTLKRGRKKDWTGYWEVSCSLQWSIPHGTASFVKYPRCRIPNTHTHTHTQRERETVPEGLCPPSYHHAVAALSLGLWVNSLCCQGPVTSAELTEYRERGRNIQSEIDRGKGGQKEREGEKYCLCTV